MLAIVFSLRHHVAGRLRHDNETPLHLRFFACLSREANSRRARFQYLASATIGSEASPSSINAPSLSSARRLASLRTKSRTNSLGVLYPPASTCRSTYCFNAAGRETLREVMPMDSDYVNLH